MTYQSAADAYEALNNYEVIVSGIDEAIEAAVEQEGARSQLATVLRGQRRIAEAKRIEADEAHRSFEAFDLEYWYELHQERLAELNADQPRSAKL